MRSKALPPLFPTLSLFRYHWPSPSPPPPAHPSSLPYSLLLSSPQHSPSDPLLFHHSHPLSHPTQHHIDFLPIPIPLVDQTSASHFCRSKSSRDGVVKRPASPSLHPVHLCGLAYHILAEVYYLAGCFVVNCGFRVVLLHFHSLPRAALRRFSCCSRAVC